MRLLGISIFILLALVKGTGAQAEDFAVEASDELFESYVRVSWTAAESKDEFFRIRRVEESVADTVLLTVASSEDVEFYDATGTPGVAYKYHVSKHLLSDDSELASDADEGSRILFAPADVEASDSEFADRIQVRWLDRSEVEAGFRVFRSGAGPDSVYSLVAELEPNVQVFEDVNVETGEIHDYCVLAFDSEGHVSVESCDEGTRGFILPPGFVQATDGIHPDRVVVTWTDVTDDEMAYRVYRDDVLVEELASDTEMFEDVDSLGVEHEYCVTAVRAFVDGGETTLVESAWGCDTGIGGTATLEPPFNVDASDDDFDGWVEISWDYASELGDGFHVTRDDSLVAELSADVRFFEDTEIAPGDSATYCVSAVSDSGGVSIDVCDLGSRAVVVAPTSVNATDGDYETHVLVTWESASTSVVLFKILRDGVPIKTVSGGTRSYEDHKIDAGMDETYEYCVVAVTAHEDDSAGACDEGYRELTAPTEVAATDNTLEDRVLITWKDESEAETGYLVSRTADGQSEVVGTTGPGAEALIDEQGVPGTEYEYSVVAVDERGESAAVVDSGGRTLAAPTEFTATQGEFEDKVVVTWKDNSSAETNYKLVGHGTVEIDADQERYELTTFPGFSGTLSLVAEDDYGSSVAATTTGSSVLASPGAVNASDGYLDKVVVSWIDNSEYEDNYKVFRDDALVGTVDEGVTRWVDTTAVAGQAYEYCVKTDAGNSLSDCISDRGIRRLPPTNEVGSVALTSRFDEPTPRTGAGFGSAVAVEGELALVGAPYANGTDSGVVHAYRWTGSGWERFQSFTHANPNDGDRFGTAVAIHNGLAIVGADGDDNSGIDQGKAFVFDYDEGDEEWKQIKDLKDPTPADDERFGSSVAIHDGNLLVGATQAPSTDGTVYVYERDSDGTWPDLPTAELVPGNPRYGWGFSIELSDKFAFIGDPFKDGETGAVSVYERSSGGSWSFRENLQLNTQVSGSRFGWAMDLEGDRLVATVLSEGVGALRRAAIFDYDRSSDEWIATSEFESTSSGDSWGLHVGIDGDYIAVATYGGITEGSEGSFQLFHQDSESGTWLEDVRLLADERSRGGPCAIDQGRFLLGAPNLDSLEGTVYFLKRLAAPQFVTATDGGSGRVQVRWEDHSFNEDGFEILRDGVSIGEVGPNREVFDDFDARPGRIHEYVVVAVSEKSPDSDPARDYGWALPDGTIGGRVSTLSGAVVSGVDVCLSPSPNGAVLLDGLGGHLQFDEVAMPDSAFTIEAWVRVPDQDGTAATLLSYLDDGADGSILVRNAANLRVKVDGNNSGPLGVSFDDGKWHHLAVSWQSSDGSLLVYKDGVLEASATVSQGGAVESEGILVIGQTLEDDGTFTDQALTGLVDEVRVWDEVRNGVDIAADMKRPLLGTESALVHYWPMDAGSGSAVADLPGVSAYGVLGAGTYWAESGAPLEVCSVTDSEGNYTISGIRYGDSQTFRVEPSLGERRFSPAFKTIVLARENPVQNEVEFFDVTSFALSGFVRFSEGSCFLAGAQILLDGTVVGATDANGRFEVATQPGDRVLSVQFEDHTFETPNLNLQVDSNVSGIEFLDTTRRRITGRVGGGCDLPIGTVSIEVTSEDGCVGPFQIDTASDFELAGLPAVRYFVRVTDVEDVPETLDRADILAFFENLGSQIVDLTAGDATQDFTYRAPLSLIVKGLPDPVCDGATLTDPETGIQIPGVPLIEQGSRTELVIEVYEDYGAGNLCPVDSGTVAIFDEIIDRGDEPTVLQIQNGKVRYTTAGNTPNVFAGRRDAQGNDRSFQKPITFVADVEGQESAQLTEWVIVTGFLPRTGTFVTATTEEIPLRILRDPPGDNSYAYYEEGYTSVGVVELQFAENYETESQVKVKTGLEFESGVPGYTTGQTTLTAVTAGFTFGVGLTQEGHIEITATTSERFATSAQETLVGRDGDVYIGVGLNVVFAKTDELFIDEDACEIVRSQGVTLGGDKDKPFETLYAYTDSHIRNTLIPQLEELVELSPDSTALFESAIENWRSHLKTNKEAVEEADVVENRSFSAGADYEASVTDGLSGRAFLTIDAFASSEAAQEMEFFVAGSGAEGVYRTKMSVAFSLRGGGGADETTTTGYVLSDDDVGDYFSVDIGKDKQFKTPTFTLVQGRSSCPWEPATQPRDSTFLAIEPPVLQDVSPDEAAVFTVSLTNASPSEELREYMLLPVQTSNPSGAVLSINGQPFNSGRSFFVDSGQTQEVTLTVERGPRRYYYEDLKIQVVPPCEFENFRNGAALQLDDTVTFSVGFAAPCSDITLFEPTSGWAYDLERSVDEENQFRLTLDDFEIQISETDSLESVGAEYRRVNTEDWTPVAAEVMRDDLPRFPNGDPKSVAIDWNVTNVPDGAYEIQGFARCSGGRSFTTVATGVIDRQRPVLAGSPQPADNVLALGDEILVNFNEKIACGSVTPNRVTLTYLEDDAPVSVAFDTVCDGKKIFIVPDEAELALLEGRLLTARLEGVEDLVGNPIAEPVEWSFEIRRGAFTWTEETLFKEAPFRNPGTLAAELVNGTATDVSFELSDLPDWLTPNVGSGSIVSGERTEIVFSIQDSLAEGTHVATVLANVPDAESPLIVAPLEVRVDVACRPPAWVARAASFEHSMTAVLQLSVDGAVSEDTNDIVAGFVGNQLRGVGRPVYVEDLDEYVVFLTLYSNRAEGENVRFKIFDADDCRLYGAADRVLRFTADRRHGTPETPIVLVAQEEPAGDPQSIALSSGWTWFSVNKLNQDMSVFNVLGDLNPTEGDLIKSQSSFSQFDASIGWVGVLDEISVTQAYAIQLTNAGNILHEGSPANPQTLIPVVDGWNWVGYPPSEEMAVNDALVNLSPEDGDVIKSQFAFAEYVESEDRWIGSLETMRPGLGYKLYLDDALQSSSFLRYPSPPGLMAAMTVSGDTGDTGDTGHKGLTDRRQKPLPTGDSEGAADGRVSRFEEDVAEGEFVSSQPANVVASFGENAPTWELTRGYQFNMTVTAKLDVDLPAGTSGGMIGAFVDGELRGAVTARYVSALGSYIAFLMVHSDRPNGENVEFFYYDPGQDEVVRIEEAMAFASDKVTGSLNEPFIFTLTPETPGGTELVPQEFALDPHYPNPFVGTVPLQLRWAQPTAEHVVVSLFDVKGRRVRTLVDEPVLPGWHSRSVDVTGVPVGMYFYRIEAGNNESVRKLAVIR